MYLKSLKVQEKLLGQEHTDTLNSINGLGRVYMSQEKFDEAAKMFLRSLDTKKRTLGKHHPSTLSTAHRLGQSYFKQEKMEEPSFRTTAHYKDLRRR